MIRRLGIAVSGLIGIVMLLAIVQYLPLPRHTYFWDRTFDTGHTIIFGLVIVCLLLIARAACGRTRLATQYFSAIICSALLGLAVEIWQRNHGRDAEWVDLFNDIAGSVSFACVFAMFDSAIPKPRTGFLKHSCLAALAGMVLTVSVWPFLRVVDIYRGRTAILPRLIDFEQPWYGKLYYSQSSDFSVVAPPADWPTSPTKPKLVGRVDAKPGTYPGFIMSEAYPDWSGYEHLEWDVYVDDKSPRVFSVRVHDQQHDMGGDYRDRFGREIELQPGFQTIRIATNDIRSSPRDREMNMQRITGFALFTSNLERPVTFFVGEARLK